MLRRLSLRAALVLGALAAGFATPTHAASTGNLLLNPGFETTLAGHPWMPAGWDTSWSTLPTVFFGRDTMLAREGRFAVGVANVSTLLPLWHNWSQTLVVGPELWNKDVVFSAWTRNNGVQGRGYILVQALRDTTGKMARLWSVSRDTARRRLGLMMANDPFLYLGAKRDYFSDEDTDWVRREVRVFIPPSTNLIHVRCGLFGTGQVFFDEATLTAEPALPAPELPVGVNLLKDPGFEGNGDDWDYSMPPYDEMRYDLDSTVVHSGKRSIRWTGGTMGMVQTRAGVLQVFCNRSLAGKRLRLTGWVKSDSMTTHAYPKIYCTTLERDEDVGAPRLVGGTTDWTKLEMEMDVPKDTYQVRAWMVYNAPSGGTVYFDDMSLEILGPATRSPAPPGKPAPAGKPARNTGRKTSAAR
jgi:hypothetical protein